MYIKDYNLFELCLIVGIEQGVIDGRRAVELLAEYVIGLAVAQTMSNQTVTVAPLLSVVKQQNVYEG